MLMPVSTSMPVSIGVASFSPSVLKKQSRLVPLVISYVAGGGCLLVFCFGRMLDTNSCGEDVFVHVRHALVLLADLVL